MANNGFSNSPSTIPLNGLDRGGRNGGSLQQAILRSLDTNAELRFQFNPKEISFSSRVTLSKGKGARAELSGFPKVSFGNIDANSVSIKNIYFDTYEEPNVDVVEKYIYKLRDFARFVRAAQDGNGGEEERTHILEFVWGDFVYLKSCFIESLDYRLTMFLPSGMPVRAVIDNLTLVETIETPSNYKR